MENEQVLTVPGRYKEIKRICEFVAAGAASRDDTASYNGLVWAVSTTSDFRFSPPGGGAEVPLASTVTPGSMEVVLPPSVVAAIGGLPAKLFVTNSCREFPFEPVTASKDLLPDGGLFTLAADPVEEIKVGFDILKSLGLRHRGVNIIACPSCARQGFNVIETVGVLEEKLAHVTTPMSLSIIGCVVNGPGEALYTDVGFTGGGKGAGMVYMAGKPHHKQDNAGMIDHIVQLVEQKAAELDAEREAAKAAAE